MKVDDIVWVSNPDREYEEEYGERVHKQFFGKVTEIENGYVSVEFDDGNKWAYEESELSLASELKDMTLNDFSNKFGLIVNGVFI